MEISTHKVLSPTTTLISRRIGMSLLYSSLSQRTRGVTWHEAIWGAFHLPWFGVPLGQAY
jgi:hypothetical protein